MNKEKQNTPTNTPTQKQFTNCELKQIEEMAKAMCVDCMPNGSCAKTDAPCDLECVYGYCAERLYDKGYRKQSEGEWIERDCITESKRGRTIHYSTQKCSVCGKWNGRHKTNFCPNCGAKMKGGAE
jgi:hypothetical protein